MFTIEPNKQVWATMAENKDSIESHSGFIGALQGFCRSVSGAFLISLTMSLSPFLLPSAIMPPQRTLVGVASIICVLGLYLAFGNFVWAMLQHRKIPHRKSYLKYLLGIVYYVYALLFGFVYFLLPLVAIFLILLIGDGGTGHHMP